MIVGAGVDITGDVDANIYSIGNLSKAECQQRCYTVNIKLNSDVNGIMYREHGNHCFCKHSMVMILKGFSHFQSCHLYG